MLFMYDFHSLRPAPGGSLDMVSCLFSYKTYAFLSAVAQFDLFRLEADAPPPFADFPPEELAHVQRIIGLLSRDNAGDSGKTVPLLLEWLARLHRAMGPETPRGD